MVITVAMLDTFHNFKEIKMSKLLTWYIDPGHGWLKVARGELHQLGILEHISSYSYQMGWEVYLEEDCDAGVYIDALVKQGHKPPFKTKVLNTNRRSKIRNYQSFAYNPSFDYPYKVQA